MKTYGTAIRILAFLFSSALTTACMSSATNFASTASAVTTTQQGTGQQSNIQQATGHVTLSWSANLGEQTVFYVEQSSDGVNFTQVQTVPNGTNQATLTGLKNGTTYYFRIHGNNPAGNSPSTQVLMAAIP